MATSFAVLQGGAHMVPQARPRGDHADGNALGHSAKNRMLEHLRKALPLGLVELCAAQPGADVELNDGAAHICVQRCMEDIIVEVYECTYKVKQELQAVTACNAHEPVVAVRQAAADLDLVLHTTTRSAWALISAVPADAKSFGKGTKCKRTDD